MNRTDTHRPSLLDPAEYEFIAAFCHRVTRTLVARQERYEANAAWREANADIVTFLTEVQKAESDYREAIEQANEANTPLPKAPRTSHPFLSDMVHTLNKWGNLSERQAAATRKFAASAAKPAPAPEPEPETPLTEGRRVITGTIVSTRWQESDFGSTPKMLVKEADGNKVWGTVADAAFESGYDAETMQSTGLTLDDLKGHEVTFTASVTRSTDDEHFGFYKRPSGMKTKEANA